MNRFFAPVALAGAASALQLSIGTLETVNQGETAAIWHEGITEANGWFMAHDAKGATLKRNFEGARQACKDNGAELAMIKS